MKKLFLLFNHTLTGEQKEDVLSSLGVGQIIIPPRDILQTWSQLPSNTLNLTPSLEPIFSWLKKEAACDDFILLQGDFGAVYLLVQFSFKSGYVPIYSTGPREAVEKHISDDTVRISHSFRHVIFRRYGQ